MTRQLALLRGINVGGRSRVPMKELVAAMEGQGFTNVSTYLQTGNILFESDETDPSALAIRLQELIAGQFGTTTPVILRTPEQLGQVSSGHPYLDDEDAPAKLHVMFLDHEAGPSDIVELDPDRSPGDRFVVEGQEIYLHYPNGAGRSKLTTDYFERRLGVTATARNWNTVLKLQSMMADRAGSSGE